MAFVSLRGAKSELAKVQLKQLICRRRYIRLRLMLLEVAQKSPLSLYGLCINIRKNELLNSLNLQFARRAPVVYV